MKKEVNHEKIMTKTFTPTPKKRANKQPFHLTRNERVSINPDDFNPSPKGSAEMMGSLFADRLRFNHGRKKWYVWDGHSFREDDTAQITHFANEVAEVRIDHSKKLSDDERRKKAYNFGLRSQSLWALKGVAELAASEPEFATRDEEWDTHPMLLAVENGVVDLRNGRLRPGKPDDLISRRAPVFYDPDAKAPTWEEFIASIFDKHTELISYVQKALGYTITGSVEEQCLFYCHGQGSNGKTTLMESMMEILGGGARGLSGTLMTNFFDRKPNAGIPNDVASLVARRMATINEISIKSTVDEAKMKELTGSKKISARFLHKEFFEFFIQAKVWITMNQLPAVLDNSNGFWRRVKVIPFPRTFDGVEKDSALGEKLLAEKSGILNWLVEGAIRWAQEGLEEPQIVKDLTAEYRSENDLVGKFINDTYTRDPQSHVFVADMTAALKQWCELNNVDVPKGQFFNQQMKAKGFKLSTKSHRRLSAWVGLKALEVETRETGEREQPSLPVYQ